MLEILTYCVYAPLSARTPTPNWLQRSRPGIKLHHMLIAFFPEISKIFGLLI
ncbi:TPA: hypothetical protein GND40_002455 [Salmonella enterica subsp. indica]|uniref:Uncharacterized protein n=2 Tax=Salmonella enterica TaxID=28901 RepID=A0A753E3Z3_SALER|nr:hypothetical protein [Salmonella enterica subsp. enterica]EDR2772604.1 hypothetical protein [Salmonella enterica subsp. enterica serovar Oslo]EDT9220801.1 hypothetical protein [Salmonella enterica subsp. indica]HAE8103026.1 hypothetical protein [Salmonella enterica subsp. indica serovar 45:a:e,n,x]EEJ0019937.1 hypothetical protein [Salmonella enterica subsp. enterica]